MSDNIFDNNTIPFFVLANSEKQHSLWPETLNIPDGWLQVFGPEHRETCLEWLNENWKDLRPNSLLEID